MKCVFQSGQGGPKGADKSAWVDGEGLVGREEHLEKRKAFYLIYIHNDCKKGRTVFQGGRKKVKIIIDSVGDPKRSPGSSKAGLCIAGKSLGPSEAEKWEDEGPRAATGYEAEKTRRVGQWQVPYSNKRRGWKDSKNQERHLKVNAMHNQTEGKAKKRGEGLGG